MKFAKTFCKPSSAVAVVPAGLQLKLQYNQYGMLQDFKIGFTANLDPMFDEKGIAYDHDAVFSKIKGVVPQSVSAKGGTTWVYGILYTDNFPTEEGEIPRSLYKSYIDGLLKGSRYEFYAGYAKSLAMQLNGSLIIRNFLTACKFNLLPQVIVPASMKEDTLNMLMDDSYPFIKPFIAGYLIYEDLNCRYVSDSLFQIRVTNDPQIELGPDGYWKSNIVSESGEKFLLSYSEILHNNVKKNSILLVEKQDFTSCIIIRATRMKTGAQLVPNDTPQPIKCPVCKKINSIGVDNAPHQCDDPHCLSHQYANVIKMLKTLKLAELSYEEYMDNVRARDVQCITDVLCLPQYKDIEITATLAQAMNAVIPSDVVPNSAILERFANRCNNSVETANYYLTSPLRIETDLDIVDPIARRLIKWLNDPYNVSTVQTILDIVHVEHRTKKFEGDPIFRGNTFILTGKFKRGDFQEIASILESYDANVYPSFEPGKKLPNAVIQGSLNEGVSGEVIQKARLHNVPIVDEDLFFTQYEIDEDMARNLL